MTTPQVLIIEHETGATPSLIERLAAAGFMARSASSLPQAREILRQARPDLILISLPQPGPGDALETGKSVHEEFALPVVYLISAAEEKLALKRGLGACDYLVTPLQERELRVVLESSLRLHEHRLQSQLTERRLRLLMERAQDVVLVLDSARIVQHCSLPAERLLGRRVEDITSRPLDDLMLPEDIACLLEAGKPEAAAVAAGIPVELRLLHHDGAWRQFEGCARNLLQDPAIQGIVLNLRDVTECRQAREQLVRAQRFESVGTLASGIAHDLNNVLAPILMGVPLLRFSLTATEDLELLDTIETSAKRATNIVKQILSLRRGMAGDRIIFQPRHVVKEVVAIAREVFPRSIEIEMGINRDLWQVSGDATQLHQAVLNLCIAARDAMAGGGRLSVQVENFLVDEVFARMYPEAKPGPHVLISVADTGTGIPPETLTNLFDPGFTPQPGAASGLGLASVAAIVRAHSGFIRVESQAGRGARFLVYLPGVGAETEPAAQARGSAPRGHGEHILVVDDEERVREVVSTVLLKHGYRVTTARDGVEGLTSYAQNVASVALVLTNIGMPNMEGLELIRMLRRINARVPILAASGILMHKHNPERAGLGIQGFLLKPFTAEELLSTVDQALRHREAPAEKSAFEPVTGLDQADEAQ